LALILSVLPYNQLYIRLIAIVRFIKIWKYGTFPVLIDITLSVYLLIDCSNNRLYNGLFLRSIISLSDLLTDKLTVSLFGQTGVCTYNHHVVCTLRGITVYSIPHLALKLSVLPYSQSFYIRIFIRQPLSGLFIKTWKYGTLPALIDIALSVNLLTAQTVVYTTGCFYTQ
jgi:hypothetical protein